MDSSVSSVCCPVTDNNHMAQNSGDDDTVLCYVANPGIGGNNTSLSNITLSVRCCQNKSR